MPSSMLSVLIRPPTFSSFSRTVTSMPASCRVRAATRPERPAPTTTQDSMLRMLTCSLLSVLVHSLHVRCCFYSLEVDVHGIFDLPGVASGHSHGYRDNTLPATLQ